VESANNGGVLRSHAMAVCYQAISTERIWVTAVMVPSYPAIGGYAVTGRTRIVRKSDYDA